MALDPRFASLISALAGKAADVISNGMTGQGAPTSGQSPDTSSPQTDAALSNPATAAALAGADAPSPAAQRAGNVAGLVVGAESGSPQAQNQNQPAQAGYGSTQASQPSQLGGKSAPADMSAEAAAQGAAGAQTSSERGLWDTIVQNLSGRTSEGAMLEGQALQDFQRGHALGGILGALGAGIGGDSIGGRLGGAVYNQAAGGLAANNAERMQTQNNDFMSAAMAALAGSGAQGGQSQEGPGGPVTQPSRQVYQPMTTSTPTGGTASQMVAEGGQLQDQAGAPLMASLDESLARMRRLSSLG